MYGTWHAVDTQLEHLLNVEIRRMRPVIYPVILDCLPISQIDARGKIVAFPEDDIEAIEEEGVISESSSDDESTAICMYP